MNLNNVDEINPTKEFSNSNSDPFAEVKKEFNGDAFPKRIREIGDHLGELYDSPKELAYFSAAAVVAGVAGDRFKLVDAIGAYEQFPNQYFVGIGDSSIGKSTVMTPLTDEIHRKENAEADADKRIIIENITSEQIAVRQSKCGQPLFSLSSEGGGIFEIINGKYSAKGNTDGVPFLNKAWSCEPYSCDRVNRPSIHIERAMLSSLWLVQPKPFEEFISNPAIEYYGLAARFLCFKAPKVARYYDGKERKRNEGIFANWGGFIGRLYDRRRGKEPITIHAVPEARKVFENYHNRYEGIKMDGTFGESFALVAKSAEKSARLALCFAVCNETDTVDEETAKHACDLVDYTNGVLLEFFEGKHVQGLERNREKMEELFQKENSQRIKASNFRVYKRLTVDEVEQVAHAYPDEFEIEKGRRCGTVVCYKVEK